MSLRMSKGMPSQIGFGLLILCLLAMPIYRAGNTNGMIAVLMIAMALVMLFSVKVEHLSRNSLPWVYLWGAVSIASLAHLLLIPTISNLGIVTTTVPAKVDSQAVDGFRIIVVWGYFTAMLIAVWRASLLSKSQVKLVICVFFLMATFQSCYGIFHLLSGSKFVLGLWEKVYGVNDVTGTYINRNNFAGLLGICWPVVLAALLPKSNKLFFQIPSMMRVMLALFFSLVLTVALITSHSRMGLIAVLFGLLIWGMLSSRFSYKHYTKASPVWLPWSIAGAAFVIMIWFGVADLAERFVQIENGNSRLEAWQSTFNLPFSVWFWGIGPGAFEDVFHLVQPTHLNVTFVKAHNDYLEFVIEFGIVFSILILAALVHLIMKVFPQGASSLRSGFYGSVAAIALHSLVDFNLQIAANALYFSVVVGLILNPNLIDTRNERMTRQKHRRGVKPGAINESNKDQNKKRTKYSARHSGRRKSFLNSLIHPD